MNIMPRDLASSLLAGAGATLVHVALKAIDSARAVPAGRPRANGGIVAAQERNR
jgi:hypothetical protein